MTVHSRRYSWRIYACLWLYFGRLSRSPADRTCNENEHMVQTGCGFTGVNDERQCFHQIVVNLSN